MKREIIHQLKSVHLGNERSVWILEPENSLETANLTIFLDGEFYRERMNTASVIETMLKAGAMEDSWIVFVSMESFEARWRECPCYPPFASFVAEELLPWLGLQYPSLRNVRKRVLVGLSYTGLAAAFVAYEKPGLFQKVICQSGSFWFQDGWLGKQFESLAHRVTADFYLDVGTQETQVNVRHREDVFQVMSQVEGVRKFRDALSTQGYNVKYVEFDGGHDFPDWKAALPQALSWALSKK